MSLRLKPWLIDSQRRTLAWLIVAPLVWFAVVAKAEDRVTSNEAALSIGANLDHVVDYSSEVPFVDLFKSSRPWIPQQDGREWGEGPPLNLSPDGQEVLSLQSGQYATTLIACMEGIPSGRYTCLYDGQGELEFEGNAQVVDANPGHLDVVVDAPGEILLHLRRTNPSDPLRRIRFVMPGHAGTYEQAPFNPAFLQQKSTYSVLRFMDWQQTNDSSQSHWSNRPRMEDPSQAHRGVAVGWMVKLANTIHVDPWFCMPHEADDEYVRQFAEEVFATLDADRRVYIEYSNEVWNGQFEQCGYAREQGERLYLHEDESVAGHYFYARRSVEVFAIWQDVFGDSDRLVRVLSAQGRYPPVSDWILSYRDTALHADALAVGAYFGGEFGTPEDAARADELTVDDVIEACRSDLPLLSRDILENSATAGQYDLPLIAYEGGQHLAAHDGAENSERLTDLIIAANRDPRMEDLYATHLADWQAAGGRLYVAFNSIRQPSKWGAWGLLEYEGQNPEQAPKYRAILKILQPPSAK